MPLRCHIANHRLSAGARWDDHWPPNPCMRHGNAGDPHMSGETARGSEMVGEIARSGPPPAGMKRYVLVRLQKRQRRPLVWYAKITGISYSTDRRSVAISRSC